MKNMNHEDLVEKHLRKDGALLFLWPVVIPVGILFVVIIGLIYGYIWLGSWVLEKFDKNY